METQFVIIEQKPIVLDRDVSAAIEAERLRDEVRRHEEFFERLARRDPRAVPPVRVL